MPTTIRLRPACRAAPSDPMVSASTQEAPPCSRPNGWMLPATGIVATTSDPDADWTLMPIRCARVPSAVVTATILSSISWFIRTSRSIARFTSRVSCAGRAPRKRVPCAWRASPEVAPKSTPPHATPQDGEKFLSHFGHIGVTWVVLTLTIQVGTCSMKGAHYARDRKTATSPSLGHHGAGSHGGDRGWGIPGSYQGKRREQRTGILERPLQQPSHTYGRALRLTRGGHPVQQHAGADVQVHADQLPRPADPAPHLRRH